MPAIPGRRTGCADAVRGRGLCLHREWRGRSSRLAETATKALQGGIIDPALQFLQAFLVSMIVGIDVEQLFERIRCFLNVSRVQVYVKKFDKNLKILMLAISLNV